MSRDSTRGRHPHGAVGNPPDAIADLTLGAPVALHGRQLWLVRTTLYRQLGAIGADRLHERSASAGAAPSLLPLDRAFWVQPPVLYSTFGLDRALGLPFVFLEVSQLPLEPAELEIHVTFLTTNRETLALISRVRGRDGFFRSVIIVHR